MSYASMHNHDHMSLLDGYATPKEYLDRAREIGLKGFATTNHGNQYSYVYFDELKKDYPEIKMIYGVETYECQDINIKDKDNKYWHLVALAKNEQGRISLNEIVTKSNLEGFYYKPRVDLEMLKPYANNLIITSACLASKIAREQDYEKCKEYVYEYKSIFPHFYLEMQSHSHPDQVEFNKKILQLSKETNTPFIITTDSHAATKEDLYYQGRHVQIAHDAETMSESYEDCYLQSEQEIHEIMDNQIGVKNVNIGLENTIKILDLIEDVSMPFQEPQLPDFPLPDGFNNLYDYLQKLVKDGWNNRGLDKLSLDEQKIRRERINYELDIIHQMNYDGYFLIVWDFINFARNNGIMVAPGRGSCAGSLVCYLLYITDLDPIKYGLIFERFLNPERISMPDTDTDVSNREKVINYIMDKYGSEKVCQVINFSYITPVVAIKDVGRILGYPYKVYDRISKKFTAETFEDCIKLNPNIYEEFSEYHDLLDIASKLSGRVRHASIHAGGVGIVTTKITDYMGMKLGSKGEQVIQVDKKMIEKIGIIKFDILGVQTLNVIQNTINELGINSYTININNPQFEMDKETYELLSEARTNGVFQVESQGMKDLLLQLQPQNMEELSAVISLYRPDTMKLLENFISYKHNPSDITYIHEDMMPILTNTYGCMIYQEQLLDIVRVFGGRTYGGADKFRKGIGKKDAKLVKQEAEKLYHEIKNNNYTEELAKQISDDMAEKGGYMFNKSHGMSYAVVCLQTAWLKKHYPTHYFKELFNTHKDDYGRLNKYIIDAKEFGIEVLPPSINKSKKEFIVYNNKILFGLQAINGIGEKLAEIILSERKNGEYKSFEDFILRVNPSTAQIVTLVKSGALPIKNKRKFLLKYAESLFSIKDYKSVQTLPRLIDLQEKWNIDTDKIKSKEERLAIYNQKREIKHKQEQVQKHKDNLLVFEEKYLQDEEYWEFQSLSTFINNNPFSEGQKYITPLNDIEDGNKCVLIGIISKITKKKDRNKKQFAFVSVYSLDGLLDVAVWHSQYKQYEDLLKRGNRLALLCRKDESKITVEEIKPYEQWLKDRKIVIDNYKNM